MTEQMLVQTAMAAVGSLGFGLLFHVSGRRLVTLALGGAASWGVYLLALQGYGARVPACFAASLATAALAEVLARLLKTPVLTLLVPMLVPLAPGGDLYYTTLALVRGDMPDFARYGELVLKEAGAISFGVIVVACVMQTANKVWALARERKE